MTYRRLTVLSFVLNGTTMICTKAVGEYDLEAFIPVVLFFAYALCGVMGVGQMQRAGKAIEGKSVLVGVVGGFGTAVGLGANMVASGMLPAYIVFPVVNGTTLLLVTLVGQVVFKERIGGYGYAGIVSGAVAIALLSA